MAVKLAAEQDRLAELRSGDMAIRACFMLSHSCLAPEQARAFSLLGLAPPGTFELASAAALVGLSSAAADAVLDELTDAHMLELPQPGRYKLHDLLRLFASGSSRRPSSPTSTPEQAGRRLISGTRPRSGPPRGR